MSCSPFDLKDYFLKELPEPEGRQVEAHVKTCQPCREELERLRLTQAALFSLRDEEIPQRIAFVSDKIFEPSRARRWWTAWAPSLAFATAALAVVAMVMRTVPATVSAPAAPPAPVVQTISDAEIQSRIDAAVSKAVAAQTTEVKSLVAELENTRRGLRLAAAEYELSQKRIGAVRLTAYSMPPEPLGEVK